MGERRRKLTMYDPAVFGVRVQGVLDKSWCEYFATQSISAKVDEAGLSSTTLISEPADQATLIGMINYLNRLGLPLLSVQCLPTSVENEPSEQEDA